MSKQPIYQIIRRRRLHQSAEKKSPPRRFASLGVGVLAFFVAVVLLTIIVGGILFALRTDQYPQIEVFHTYFDPENGVLLEPTRFYDRSGAEVLYTLAPPDVERSFLSFEEFSSDLVNVTVAVDDPTYWGNFGLEQDSIPAILVDRVLMVSDSDDAIIRSWLVANLLFSEGHEQILAWYLNSNSYGWNTLGVEQAAQLYLGKSAAELSLAESALLAAVHQSPALNPFDAPKAALENKDGLLLELLEQGTISETEYQTALQEEIQLLPAPEKENVASVIELIQDTLSAEIPVEQLLLGGYRVITTIDADLQNQSQCVLAEQLARINDPEHVIDVELLDTCSAVRYLTVLPPDESETDYEAAASSILLDPKTGEVLAFVQQEDLTVSVRLSQQPGSSLAPFVALAGFRQGESPASLHWDIPADDPVELAPYISADHVYSGPLRSREVVIQQNSLVLAEWMLSLGESEVVGFSQAAGLSSLQDQSSNTQLLFEGGDIPLTEQAFAYGTFANLGIQNGVIVSETQQLGPQLIRDVINPFGESTALNCTDSQSRVLVGEDLAYLVHDVLADEVLRRNEYGYPNPLSIGHPVGGLLSSSDNDQQRWALGYTPQLVGGVWLGTQNGDALPWQAAGNTWHALMTYALQNEPVESWTVPSNIISMTVCSPSGLLPTTACQQLVNEIFIDGNQPVQLDNLYQIFSINRETGRLATAFSPLELIDEQIFLVVPAEAQAWAQENGLSVPPVDYDTIQQVQNYPSVYFTAPDNFSYVSGAVEIWGTAAGDDFKSYTLQVGEGLNPSQWIVIQSDQEESVTDQILGIWDTAGLEGLYAVRLVVEREGQQLESALLQVTVDNTAPTMTILSPFAEETLHINEDGEVVFQVHPQDNLNIAAVRWFVDGELVASRQQSPYTVFVVISKGEHTLEVEAVDQAGNLTRSEELIFTVDD